MNQKLLFVIATFLLIGIGSLFAVREYKLAQKNQLQTQNLLSQQQVEIENLEKQVASTPAISPRSRANSTPSSTNGTITASDLAPYLDGVVRITCHNSDGDAFGSGSLWNFKNLGYSVLTNQHVIRGINQGLDDRGSGIVNNACAVDFKEGTLGLYYLDLNNSYHWNNKADAAALPIYFFQTLYTNLMSNAPPESQALLLKAGKPVNILNYTISNLHLCSTAIAEDSPVSVVGYPAFGYTAFSNSYASGTEPHRIVTNGIISSIFTDDETGTRLPYPNYFVSAKMDSGDSGGIAFSKDAKGLCLLGIPTWLNTGNYENEGMVQNIRNILD